MSTTDKTMCKNPVENGLQTVILPFRQFQTMRNSKSKTLGKAEHLARKKRKKQQQQKIQGTRLSSKDLFFIFNNIAKHDKNRQQISDLFICNSNGSHVNI